MSTTASEVIEEIFKQASRDETTAMIADPLRSLWEEGKWAAEDIAAAARTAAEDVS